MPRYAALDIGTNTVLLAVAELGEDGRWTPLLERGEITRLGQGVDRTGVLAPEAIARTVRVIVQFVDQARSLGAERITAAATSAARDAHNRAVLVDQVREMAGLELDIIPGPREAELVFRAVQEDFGETGRPLIAVDIGGGSTEVIFGARRGPPTFRTSLDVGSVRLTERHLQTNPIPASDRSELKDRIRSVLGAVPTPPPGARLVAVAATATSLAAVAHALPSLDDPRVHGSELTRAELSPLLEYLADLDLEARRQVPGLDPKRADVICAGGYILLEVMERLGMETCRVSDRGVRWGLLLEQASRRDARGR